MKEVSLLWTEHREGYHRQVAELSDAAVEDLRLDEISAATNAGRAKDILGVMRTLPTDEGGKTTIMQAVG